MSAYGDAVTALYRAPFTDFVTERKRLSAELKQAGDKEGAAKLGKLARPPASAWAVNQLWWLERQAFEALLAAAARVKVGDRDASRAHREALALLREHATRVLQEGGNAATDATLRRVTTTLSAIAAAGSFEPEPPGALSADRDPPGFEALGFAAGPPREKKPKEDPAAPPRETTPKEDAAAHALEAERRRAAAEAQKQRLAERERLSTQVRDARHLQAAQRRELSRLRAEVETAEQGLEQTQALLEELDIKLTNL